MHRALVVGINAYPSAPLNGCVNDAQDWSRLLDSREYEVTTLLDQAATKAAVVHGLEEMVSASKFGDRIVFQFSGHGTWIADRDGDEPDGRDEALCCYDYRNGGLLLDDELHKILANRKFGVRATILSDTCHSGSVSRFAGSPSASTETARFIPPSHFLEGTELARAAKVEQKAVRARPASNAVLISGCADHEFSYDASFNGRPNGAFTRAAIDTYSAGKSTVGWHRAIRERLPSTRFPQAPQLTASKYQKYSRAL